MFGLGFGEMVVIAMLAIIVVGPARLPTLMKTVGNAMRQLRQASRDIRSTVGFDELIDLDERPRRAPVARAKPAPDTATAPTIAAHAAPVEAPQSIPRESAQHVLSDDSSAARGDGNASPIPGDDSSNAGR